MTERSTQRREAAYLMNGQTVIVLISQGCRIVGRVVILVSGHYLKGVWLPTGQHKSRKMAYDFGLGRNHHSWNKDNWILTFLRGAFQGTKITQSISQLRGINITIRRQRKKRKRLNQINFEGGVHFYKFLTTAGTKQNEKGAWRKQNWEVTDIVPRIPLGTYEQDRP